MKKILTVLIIVLSLSACQNNDSINVTQSDFEIAPGKTITFTSSGSNSVSGTLLDLVNDGQVDSIDFDENLKTAEFVFMASPVIDSYEAIDINNDKNIDTYLKISSAGTAELNTASLGDGSETFISLDDDNKVVGIDNNSDTVCDIYISSVSSVMADTSPPTPGNSGIITTTSVVSSSLTLNWTEASDDTNSHACLQYLAYYSVSDNLNSVEDCEANGIEIGDYESGIISRNVSGLSEATAYYFNVVVKDTWGKKEAYSAVIQITSNVSDTQPPTPGNSGSITAVATGTESITLNWDESVDDTTSTSELQYQVFYSAANNLDSVADCEANGTAFDSYYSNITSKVITGLTASTTYFFNIIVKDISGNKAVYTTTSQTTSEPDTMAPVPGNSGTLTFSGISSTNLTINWVEASDNADSQNQLKYQVYYSTSNNLDTLTNVETNGTPVGDFAADISSKTVTGLTASTAYYFNVVIQDTSGNRAIYTSGSITTAAEPDTTSPIPGNSGMISFSGVSPSAITLSWTEAADNVNEQSQILYLVYYSTSNNLDTVTNVLTNGTQVGSITAGISSKNVTGLSASTTYYFNVLVQDTSGNKAVYTSNSQATGMAADSIAPMAGNSGAITFAGVAGTSLTLNWTKATDNTDSQNQLQYRVFYSTSNNLDSVSNVETNGTEVGTITADIATKNVTGLNSSTTYYFNVLVQDTSGNKAVYTSGSQDTLDVTAPTPGNSGTIAFASVAGTSLTVNWTKAADNNDSQSQLQYRVFYSTSNNLDSVSNVETNGTEVGTITADIATRSVTGLNSSTTYYFNILVQDTSGNKAIYTSGSQDTLDVTAPTPGNSGTITFASVAGTSLTLNWTKAADNTDSQNQLQYRVFYSTSNNLDSVSNVETNGTEVGTITADIAIKNVTGLNSSTTYYFNILVQDTSGNKAIYTSGSQDTLDVTAPTPGNSGTITFASVAGTSLTLNWTKAADNTDSQNQLQYRVFYSTSNNLDSVSNVETNGTEIGSITADIATKNVTGLNSSTTYYFNILVQDTSGNKAIYTSGSQDTLDVTAPTPGNSGTITFASVAGTSLTLNWTKATDNTDSQNQLQYRVFYSTSNNLDSVSNVETNGTEVGTITADIATRSVTGLNSSTTYYFNVLVQDTSGNKAIYTSGSQDTLDVTAPTPGNSGTITFASVAGTSLTLNWTKATDNTDSQNQLQYRVFYSTSNNLDSVSNVETNGTEVGTITADIATKNVTGLNSSTTYYFNVLVQDTSGNKAIYTSGSQDTLDVTAPTPGNSGTITFASVAGTSLTLNWTKAADNTDSQNQLQYRVFYSTSNNLDSVSNVETNGTEVGTITADIATKNVTGLNSSTTYYFNILVQDTSGNKAIYTSGSQDTLDVTAPTPGNSGTITFASVAGTSLTLNWTKAADNTDSQNQLQYRVFYSTSNNLDSVSNVETNGTEVGTITADIAIKNVTGLNSSTTYYFNILVQDTSGNKAIYTSGSQDTLDVTAPTPGNSGIITFASVAGTSLTLNWTKAADNNDSQSQLQYRVFYSTSNNLDSVSNVETNGTEVGTITADIATKNVTGLSASTTYYFNVLVQDTSGNKAIYTSNSQATIAAPDTTPPTPGDSGTITTSNITDSSITITWLIAVDDIDVSEDLDYLVYYSTSNNISDVSACESNGTAVGSYAANIDTKDVSSGLSADTTYYFNVVVKDTSNNKAAYTTVSGATKTAKPSDYVIRWGFNNNGNDELGNYDLSIYDGDPTYNSSVQKEGSHCLEVDGTADALISSVYTFPGNALSISAWLYLDSTVPNAIPIAVDYYDIGFSYEAGELVGAMSVPDRATYSINQNTWYHAVMTWDGTNIKLYLDGNSTPVATSTNTDIITGFSYEWTVGDIYTQGYEWKGYIDDIIVYDRVLSASEVSDIYNSY